jgi:K(+)-stimulated pyrophosphate-energized sodium pump
MKRIRRVLALVPILLLLPVASVFAQGGGTSSRDLMWITWVGSIAALLFALYLAISVMRKDPGTSRMQEISKAVQEGAMAYLKQQYSVVGIVFVAVFLLLMLLSFGLGLISRFVPFAFITGGFFSGLSGFIGMSVATRANCRTAAAAKEGLNPALRVAF